jgi:hypothetical protein
MRVVCASRLSDQSGFGWIRTTRLAALALFACSSAAALAAPPVHVGTLAPAQPNQAERFGFAVDVHGDLAVVVAYGDSLEGQLFRGSASVYDFGNEVVREIELRLTALDGAAFNDNGFGSTLTLANRSHRGRTACIAQRKGSSTRDGGARCTARTLNTGSDPTRVRFYHLR